MKRMNKEYILKVQPLSSYATNIHFKLFLDNNHLCRAGKFAF